MRRRPRQSKSYPRTTATREPSLACKRLLDTNILLDALFESQARHTVVAPWFVRLLHLAPAGRLLIPASVHDEYLWVARKKELADSAEHAISLLEKVLRHPGVQVIANANPAPRRLHRAILQMPDTKQLKIADLRIAFTALHHRAVFCTADKDFRAVKEVLPRLEFYDPADFQK